MKATVVGHLRDTFDIDVELGVEGENHVADIFNNPNKVEVKTDRISRRTGNIAVEIRYKGKPSGLSTTSATVWAFVILPERTTILVPVERLKELCRKHFPLNAVMGGYNQQSLLVLIPRSEL